MSWMRMAIVMLQWGCAVDRWRLLRRCERKVAVLPPPTQRAMLEGAGFKKLTHGTVKPFHVRAQHARRKEALGHGVR